MYCLTGGLPQALAVPTLLPDLQYELLVYAVAAAAASRTGKRPRGWRRTVGRLRAQQLRLYETVTVAAGGDDGCRRLRFDIVQCDRLHFGLPAAKGGQRAERLDVAGVGVRLLSFGAHTGKAYGTVWALNRKLKYIT